MIIRWNRGQKIALGMIAILLSILLVELFWIFILSPRLTIEKVFLESDIEIPDDQLLEMLDLDGKTWTSVDGEGVRERLESHPMIREAQVSQVFPDGLRVYIYRRRPLALALFDDGAITRITAFDEEGYIIQASGKISAVDLPILSGIPVHRSASGTQTPETMRQVLSDLLRLKADEPELFALISEIEFIPHGEIGYDLKTYMNHIPIPVLMDMNLSPESIRHALLVIDILALRGFELVEEADIRGGHVIYRPTGKHGG